MATLNKELIELLIKDGCPEEAITTLQEFTDYVEEYELHPMSNEYRWLEMQTLLRIGIIIGRTLHD